MLDIKKCNLFFITQILLLLPISLFSQDLAEFRDFFRTSEMRKTIGFKTSGSGFFISNNGYIITNHHVIKGGKEFLISHVDQDLSKYYRADLIASDESKDLALLKIQYNFYPELGYGIDWNQQELTERVRVFGFPAPDIMGLNLKATAGEVNSTAGYEGNIEEFQISAEVQGGNSGGPVFDNNGNIVGIVVAGIDHVKFKNVSYAIKTSILRIFLNSISTKVNLLKTNNSGNEDIEEYKRGTVYIENYRTSFEDFVSLKRRAEDRALENARIAADRKRQQERDEQRRREQVAERARKEALFVPIIQRGKSAFNQRQYQQALNFYQEALAILPNDYRAKDGINEVNDRLDFLKEKEYTFYEYKEFERSDYNTIKLRIENSLDDLRGVNSEFRGAIIFSREESGQTRFEINSSVNRGYDIESKLESVARQITLKPVSKFGYPVKSKTSIPINFSSTTKIVEATKTNVKITTKTERSRVSSVIRYSPMGNYKVSLNYGSINGNEFENNFVTDYSGIGGPSNAFKSLIIPGAGVKSVTGGKKKGFGRAAFTYSLFGTAIGLKILSNNEYDKYLSATDQNVINNHYQNAVNYNKAFYGLLLSGALVWTYDILWVTKKGFNNKSAQKKYKKSIALGFTSNLNSPNLTVNYSF